MRKIIVNADDFGRHELINQAVALGVERGFLRSATIMPGGVAFAGAVAVAKSHANLGVGVHFTLVNGTPVLPPTEIPTLVRPNGTFYDDYGSFMKRYVQGKFSLTEVRAELAAQLNKVQNTKLTLTHVDSHQHLHHLPGIIGIVLDLAAAANIKKLRIARTKLSVSGEATGVGQLIGRLGLGTLAAMAARKAVKHGFIMPDHFAGIVAGEAVNAEYMRRFIINAASGTTEIMLHPGIDNEILSVECGWVHDFAAELNAVTSQKLADLLTEQNIESINYDSLPI